MLGVFSVRMFSFTVIGYDCLFVDVMTNEQLTAIMLEQRSVIRFLTLQKVPPTEIQRQLNVIYGSEMMLKLVVRNWCCHFCNR